MVQTHLASQHGGTREHAREETAIPVKFESDNETHEGITEYVSSGGAFIKSEWALSTGKYIRMEIPLKKKGKIARLVALVTRTSLRGFAIKFLKSK